MFIKICIFKEPYQENSFLSLTTNPLFPAIFSPKSGKQSPNLVTLSLHRYPQINRFVTYISKRIQISCSHFGNLISRLPPLKRLQGKNATKTKMNGGGGRTEDEDLRNNIYNSDIFLQLTNYANLSIVHLMMNILKFFWYSILCGISKANITCHWEYICAY